MDSELRSQDHGAPPGGADRRRADPESPVRARAGRPRGATASSRPPASTSSRTSIRWSPPLDGEGGDEQPPLLSRGRFNDGLIETAILQHADERAQAGSRPTTGTRLVVIAETERRADHGGRVRRARPARARLRGGRQARARRQGVGHQRHRQCRGDEPGSRHRRRQCLGGGAIRRPHRTCPAAAGDRQPAAGRSTGSRQAATSTAACAPSLRAETRDDAAAQNLREVIRGFMALARLQAGQRQARVMPSSSNSLELGGTGKTVSLGFSRRYRRDRRAGRAARLPDGAARPRAAGAAGARP